MINKYLPILILFVNIYVFPQNDITIYNLTPDTKKILSSSRSYNEFASEENIREFNQILKKTREETDEMIERQVLLDAIEKVGTESLIDLLPKFHPAINVLANSLKEVDSYRRDKITEELITERRELLDDQIINYLADKIMDNPELISNYDSVSDSQFNSLFALSNNTKDLFDRDDLPIANQQLNKYIMSFVGVNRDQIKKLNSISEANTNDIDLLGMELDEFKHRYEENYDALSKRINDLQNGNKDILFDIEMQRKNEEDIFHQLNRNTEQFAVDLADEINVVYENMQKIENAQTQILSHVQEISDLANSNVNKIHENSERILLNEEQGRENRELINNQSELISQNEDNINFLGSIVFNSLTPEDRLAALKNDESYLPYHGSFEEKQREINLLTEIVEKKEIIEAAQTTIAIAGSLQQIGNNLGFITDSETNDIISGVLSAGQLGVSIYSGNVMGVMSSLVSLSSLFGGDSDTNPEYEYFKILNQGILDIREDISVLNKNINVVSEQVEGLSDKIDYYAEVNIEALTAIHSQLLVIDEKVDLAHIKLDAIILDDYLKRERVYDMMSSKGMRSISELDIDKIYMDNFFLDYFNDLDVIQWHSQSSMNKTFLLGLMDITSNENMLPFWNKTNTETINYKKNIIEPSLDFLLSSSENDLNLLLIPPRGICDDMSYFRIDVSNLSPYCVKEDLLYPISSLFTANLAYDLLVFLPWFELGIVNSKHDISEEFVIKNINEHGDLYILESLSLVQNTLRIVNIALMQQVLISGGPYINRVKNSILNNETKAIELVRNNGLLQTNLIIRLFSDYIESLSYEDIILFKESYNDFYAIRDKERAITDLNSIMKGDDFLFHNKDGKLYLKFTNIDIEMEAISPDIILDQNVIYPAVLYDLIDLRNKLSVKEEELMFSRNLYIE